jgi:hypothetical protein
LNYTFQNIFGESNCIILYLPWPYKEAYSSFPLMSPVAIAVFCLPHGPFTDEDIDVAVVK